MKTTGPAGSIESAGPGPQVPPCTTRKPDRMTATWHQPGTESAAEPPPEKGLPAYTRPIAAGIGTAFEQTAGVHHHGAGMTHGFIIGQQHIHFMTQRAQGVDRGLR